MNLETSISTFYQQLDRDLFFYMLAVAAAFAIACTTYIATRWRGVFAATVVLAVAGGVLCLAANHFRADIPNREADDLRSMRLDPNATRLAIMDRYRHDRSTAHFRRLALIWAALAGTALVAMLFIRRPVVNGISSAVMFLAVASFLLDLRSYRRDLAFAEFWQQQEHAVNANGSR